MCASKALELKHHLLHQCKTHTHLQTLHARLIRSGLDRDPFLAEPFITSCFDLRDPVRARLAFLNQADPPSISLWNTMLRGLVSADRTREALRFYGLMRAEGLSPTHFTFPFVLKACARLVDLKLGRRIHTHVWKCGFESDVFVKTSLVCLYAKCGSLVDAHEMFDEMQVRNAVSWTALITGYMENGLLEKALEFFKTSIGGDLKPDSFALSRVLSVCSRLGDLRNGEWIHRYIEEEDMGSNVFVATSLVDMYAKCGSTGKAREVFDRMVVKDVVSWSAMIGGYSLNGQPKEALELFHLMCSENIRPDEFTVVAVLSACAKLGALDLGDSVRRTIDANVLTTNLVVGTAVIDMYSKCGSVIKAWKVFKDMKGRDRILWNAMMCGLALNGHSKPAFGLFGEMEKSGFSPDGNTFVGLLCSCTHSGLVKEGKKYFESMKRVFNLTPKVEHYGCMVDLLGRVGLLDEAYRLIQEMPIEPNSVVWGSLLGACRTYRDTHLAECALKQLIELEPWNAGNYILLSNIYASSARWDDTAKLRETMIERGISKPPAFSWVEVKGVVHEFRVGERSHPSIDAVYAKLEELVKRMRELGHVPASELVMFDVEEEEKEQSIGCHSEKLAVAFALIAVPPGDVIRVVKNLRVCNDCHGFLKLVSVIMSRDIVVRDNNRFHCFTEGSCSCNDFW